MSLKAEGGGWSGDRLSDWSQLRIGPKNVGPHLVSHQKLRHPGGPGDPVRAIKDRDISKSILERHSDRKARKSIISDHCYVKMRGKIRDNARAIESEVICYVLLNCGHCPWRKPIKASG